ncbi:HupE/UreJ family protein [Pseudoduganella ginsengisoli]|uniref:HupE/UreJ family protein n=1 Tax=Pseudoduganella ginsengisoli TaxID=1462440 RepID=A0A6L6PWA4_9BURK|nr:HupE/UreJ family protein [Pseudoduganella ginsengisoli]MTW01434.1 HupE/UreJ family protein [Pseudoduganella ginsengisoli]
MNTRRFPAWRTLILLLLCCICQPACAHKPSDSYLLLRVDGSHVAGQWDIALRDLDDAIGLDGDGDGQLTWDELRVRHGAIAAYAMARLQLSAAGQPCRLAPQGQQVDRHTDGAYTVLRFTATCAAPLQALHIGYRAFADIDAQHKGLLRVEYGDTVRTAILGADQPEQTIELVHPHPWREFQTYLTHGAWHIWIGYDHILFLLSLLLPAVLVRSGQRWQATPALRPALADVVKTVTAFTAAHSITLSAAAMGAATLPSRWVESAIAASVIAAALNNVVPLVQGRRWLLACGFGLLHGFGFAGVLADLGLPAGARALALAGFNLGVEIGQLAIVALFVPLAYYLRASPWYPRLALHGGSLAIALLAAVWLTERAFDIPLFKALL